MRLPVRVAVSFWLLVVSLASPSRGQDEIKPIEETLRQWTVSTPGGNRTLDARLVGLRQGEAQFQQPNGRTLSVPLDQLSKEDRRAALIDRVGSGVVEISTKDLFGVERGLGSGFVMHASGLIVTNYHVIAGAGKVEAKFRDHEKKHPADVLSVDREHDVAFLRVTPLPQSVHVVELQSTQLPVPGSAVWAIGHPNGLKNTVGWGDVNAVRKTSEMPEQFRLAFRTPADSRWLQTNAVLARGSSGGPLLNELGKVVGVNTLLLGPQIGMAIHISHARKAFLDARNASPQPLPLAPGDHEDAMGWPSREVAPLLKGYIQEFEQLKAAAANLPQAETFSRLKALRKKYRQQFLQLLQQAPQGWPGIQSLAYAAQFCEGEETNAELQQICQLALQHHAESQHLAAFLKAVEQQPTDTARDFIRQVSKATPHESLRTQARFRLTGSLLQWLHSPDSIELTKIRRTRDEIDQLIGALEKDTEKADGPIAGEEGKAVVDALRKQFQSLRIGTQSPETQGVDIQGQQFKLSDYRGKAVLLDFFADWCPHCRRMYPGERAMVEKLKDKPFALLGVHCENQRVLDELVKKKAVTWRSWADGEGGPIAVNWGVDSYPTMVLIDHDGIVRWQSNGVPNDEELDKLVDQLVKEAAAR